MNVWNGFLNLNDESLLVYLKNYGTPTPGDISAGRQHSCYTFTMYEINYRDSVTKKLTTFSVYPYSRNY